MDGRQFESMLKRVMKADFAAGAEAFHDALLERCLAELGADPHAADDAVAGMLEAELSDADLDLLAAAGDVMAQSRPDEGRFPGEGLL